MTAFVKQVQRAKLRPMWSAAVAFVVVLAVGIPPALLVRALRESDAINEVRIRAVECTLATVLDGLK